MLIAPFWEGGAPASEQLAPATLPAIHSGDFQGKLGETALVYPDGEKEKRVLLLGLGKKGESTPEKIRRAIGAAVKMARSKKARHAALLFPKGQPVEAVLEALFLANYAFDELKTESKENPLIESLAIFGLDPKGRKEVQRAEKIAGAVAFSRDLVNGNADDINPETLPKEAKKALGTNIRFSLLDRKKLEKEKMGLLLAVGKGAQWEPCMIEAEYRGNSKSKETFLIVGKGVTYDTGGLCLKPSDNMKTMKADMGGAAAILGALKIVSDLKMKINVTALVPLAENAIGSKSYKLGDVYRSVSGKTVEVLNTDAEGRLILADALAYGVEKYRPALVLDAATLTGAVVIALGEEIAGFYSNDDRAASDLCKASDATGESAWRLPLYDYKSALKSDIADIANIGGGRDAGSMKAALFLQEFIGNSKWVHIDLAGPAYFDKPKYYHPTRGTGWGARLIASFLESRVGR